MIGWCEYGAARGRPVFAFHGTPSSRLALASLDAAASAHSLRIIAVDRPGIGASSPLPGFGLLDWPGEISVVADALALDTYAVLGVSGGGPFALACGIDPDPRLSLIATAGGAAPYDRPDAVAKVTASDRIAETLAGRWPAAAAVMLRAMGFSARRLPQVAWRAWRPELAPADRQALERLPLDQRLEAFNESLRAGAAGDVDDYRLLAGPWGFLPEEVAVPAVMWHGADDPTVPLHHAQDLFIRIPRCELFVVPGAGHLLTFTHPDVIMAALARRLAGEGAKDASANALAGGSRCGPAPAPASHRAAARASS